MLKYGTSVWRVYNQNLEGFQARYPSACFLQAFAGLSEVACVCTSSRNASIVFWQNNKRVLMDTLWTGPWCCRLHAIVQDHTHEIEVLNRERKLNQVCCSACLVCHQSCGACWLCICLFFPNHCNAFCPIESSSSPISPFHFFQAISLPFIQPIVPPVLLESRSKGFMHDHVCLAKAIT